LDFLHKQHTHLCYKWTLKVFSRTYHFHTVAQKVTEEQMLQLTPYAGLIVTDRRVSCNTCV